jgi:hypothetical protein
MDSPLETKQRLELFSDSLPTTIKDQSHFAPCIFDLSFSILRIEQLVLCNGNLIDGVRRVTTQLATAPDGMCLVSASKEPPD